MNTQVPELHVAEGPAHVVTGVELDARGEVKRVRWYLADRSELDRAAGVAPKPLSRETVVDTLEVVDKLLDAEAVVPLFPGSGKGVPIGQVVKVHVQADGTELIEVDPSVPGRTLRDLPRL
ncbi:hypothetical protein [Pseudorhodoferax sp.]|uniref:hypothetical protein n=1 Tax=Pseudorhodoferax sp. TaxID=1993553 RepID=UPI002DD622B1|nr:hypothetical protein [Pseudorhodoferax sp.]